MKKKKDATSSPSLSLIHQDWQVKTCRIRKVLNHQEIQMQHNQRNLMVYLSKGERNQRKHYQRFWSRNWIFKMLGGRTRSQSWRRLKWSIWHLAVPLRSRHAPEVLRAVSSLYVRLRGLGLPIYRLHSDRAREFTGKLMRDWILSHDMEHTTTAADESAGNGRVESEIAHLKHHTKLLLTTARAPATYWPMSLRHASEYRFRKTLEQLGVPVPRLIPFGTEAIAKSKFWHRTMKGFPTPMQKVRVWGPAVGMSLSSKGYWIEADGKWMRSTVVVQPGERPDLRPDLPLEAQAELLDNASIAMSEDQQEVVAPNQVDAEGQPVVNLEQIDQDDQVQWVPKRRFHMKKPLIPGSEDATLRMRMLCSNRGECYQEEALENAWATLEHLHLRKLETEERRLTTGDLQSMEVIARLGEQCKDIEKKIEEQNEEQKAVREAEEEEVLVNQPVPLEEVRRNLPQWKEALKKEYDSLKGYGAIRPIGAKEYAELQEQYEVVESLPTMLVAVKKPPMKLKARVVACGNHAQEATGCTTAGGVDTVVVRTLVSLAAYKDLTILTSDIKTAFCRLREDWHQDGLRSWHHQQFWEKPSSCNFKARGGWWKRQCTDWQKVRRTGAITGTCECRQWSGHHKVSKDGSGGLQNHTCGRFANKMSSLRSRSRRWSVTLQSMWMT